jgi:hypothetical protein
LVLVPAGDMIQIGPPTEVRAFSSGLMIGRNGNQ